MNKEATQSWQFIYSETSGTWLRSVVFVTFLFVQFIFEMFTIMAK